MAQSIEFIGIHNFFVKHFFAVMYIQWNTRWCLCTVLPILLNTFVSPFNDQNKREYSWKILNSSNIWYIGYKCCFKCVLQGSIAERAASGKQIGNIATISRNNTSGIRSWLESAYRWGSSSITCWNSGESVTDVFESKMKMYLY